ncbi:OLC1v1023882C1 [Oldenlandia corymbosa var. corymbosa]|uniref:OLC1v1023882C1 n=1 Tax=Oldenlandia corymbosa var. corymbosa TaxID=529605 RepID=A0AAV1C0Y4_OLDCO|nr:OLC1v1023882C1 [Oldenlandia corymbosa var. corymbosa]
MLRLLKRNSGLGIGLKRRLLSTTCKAGDKTTVMSFGDGSHGALGLPSSLIGLGSAANEPTPISDLPPNISTIAAGHYHSLAVTSDGHVWSWGRNNEFQLGRDPLSPRGTWNEPKRVEGLNEVRVQSAFASGVISAAIGDDGSLWVWGKSKRGQLGIGEEVTGAVSPSRVTGLDGEEIVKVSLGWGHVLALTKCGKLFGWGYYADGRLGKVGRDFEPSALDAAAGKSLSSQGNSGSMLDTAEKLVSESIAKENDMPIIWEPCLIEELQGTEVVDTRGLDHSLILCRDGTLLSCGSNAYGQLGRRKLDLGLLPVDIKLRPLSVASGMGHSFAICEDHLSENCEGTLVLVSWGWNRNSQLGREGMDNIPLVVAALSGETPISISGGRAHSMAVTARKELWTWGCGRNGRLGLGSSTDETEPMVVDYLEGCEVLQAVAGFDHSLVLVSGA